MKGPNRSRKRWNMWGPAYNGRLPKLAAVWRDYAPGGVPFLGLAPEQAARRVALNSFRVQEMELARDVAELVDAEGLTPRAAALKLAGDSIETWRKYEPRWWVRTGRNRIAAMRAALHDAIYRAWRKHRGDIATIFANEPA